MKEKKGTIEVTIKMDGKELDTLKDLKGIILNAMNADGNFVAICGEMGITDMITALVCITQASDKMKIAYKIAKSIMEDMSEKEMDKMLSGKTILRDEIMDLMSQEGGEGEK